MNHLFPEGALLKMTVEVRLPNAASESDIDAWLRFSLAGSGSIKQDNPLYSNEPEVFGPNGIDWDWPGFVGRAEEYDHIPTENGGARYRVRYIRERHPLQVSTPALDKAQAVKSVNTVVSHGVDEPG